MQIEAWRVAQIIVDRGSRSEDSRGSGYLVSPGRILTAAHVVNGASQVRVVLDVDQPTQINVTATSWWVDPLAEEGTDLAVISIPEGAIEARTCEPAHYGRISDQTGVLNFQTLGFPLFKARHDHRGRGTIRELEQVEGRVPVAANRRQRTLAAYLDAPPPAAPAPGEGSPWEGMSGAAVWVDHRIVGVIAEHHQREGTGRLTARRLDRAYSLLGASEFAVFRQLLGLPEILEELADVVLPEPDLPLVEPLVELDALPYPLVDSLIGREPEARLLREFLADDGVSVVSITGFGGNGKSALVDAFLSDIAPSYDGAQRIYGWHFFSQEEQGAPLANSSAFWERALRFFGFPGDLPTHEAEKAHELLKLLRQHRALLVLDGIEPLQNPPHVNSGTLTDNAMQAFLTSVARDGLPHGGLVIVTSRQRLVELKRFKFAREIELQTLDAESGVLLLRQIGVRGSPTELQATAVEYRGHPLSLILLGRILATDHQGDVLSRFGVDLTAGEFESNVDTILSYYGQAWAENGPELSVMYMLSLFRRPMTDDEFNVLKTRSLIGESIRALPMSQVARAISHLSGYGLLIYRGREYDTHALIRRYFAARFRGRNEGAFLQAHEVLFKYFRELAQEEAPADLEGLEPLYRAIYHGCMAGKYSAALDIYWRRISRGSSFFSQKQLGAFSSDLAAVATFFPDGWESPVLGDLTEEQRAWLLAVASFELTALGRLTEALTPRYAEIAMFEALGNWRLVCGDLRNLVQILLPLGRLAEALRVSERAVSVAARLQELPRSGRYSEETNDTVLRVSAMVRQATVLHRLGRIEEAGPLFQEAERIYGRILDQVNGYYYGLFLLTTARDIEDLHGILHRGEENLRTANAARNLGRMGNGHFTIGQALGRLADSDRAEQHLNEAIVLFQRANRVDRLPSALLERAAVRRAQWLRTGSEHDLAKCESDIDEAEQQISFSNMVLYSVDLSLLKAEILVDRAEFNSARELIRSTIVSGIRTTGYRLRLADVGELDRRLREEGSNATGE